MRVTLLCPTASIIVGEEIMTLNYLPNLVQILFIHLILFQQIQLSFSKDGKIPEVEAVVIDNKPVSEAVLETMIGKNAVSPDLKQSLASRLPNLLRDGKLNATI